ncbi:uncharacterized protein LOC127872359 [Dreissena polymorpha]|uniref:uncharacterized protein LOC127872359 n=1 Tax=Dreissena polymorpha TaxID=45954 RepID=UPI002263CA4C|nr:uncharacterized protein LOC127872359 [Dreissena polymorpha]
MVSEDDVCLPRMDNLTRAVNLHCQKMRSQEPCDLNFDLDREYIGDNFILDDISYEDQRHIVFATTEQLGELKQSRKWFVDGTFKLVKRPFYQLVTIHAFVRKGEDTKQVPLVYILMSRRTKQDYIQVLSSIHRYLDSPLVEWFMVDFEAAAWQAIRDVFPGCVIKGCVFHWVQRIYRKVMNEGFKTAYTNKGDKYLFLRKVMSLPYLPDEHITSAFNQLHQQATEVGGPVLKVLDYVEKT